MQEHETTPKEQLEAQFDDALKKIQAIITELQAYKTEGKEPDDHKSELTDNLVEQTALLAKLRQEILQLT